MPIAVRSRRDPLPRMQALQSLTVSCESSASVMSMLQQRPQADIAQRFEEGHRAYVAYLDTTPVAWGWVATRTAAIGELGFSFRLLPHERYLWNFVTLAPYRGRGIYPRLVDAIVRAESAEADRFWIVYAPENRASGAGVHRAGFVDVADLSFTQHGAPALRDLLPGGARIAARVLGVAIDSKPLAPCWRCERSAATGTASGRSCAMGECQCDYQEPRSGCAASTFASTRIVA